MNLIHAWSVQFRLIYQGVGLISADALTAGAGVRHLRAYTAWLLRPHVLLSGSSVFTTCMSVMPLFDFYKVLH
jgi:hypothetical protein